LDFKRGQPYVEEDFDLLLMSVALATESLALKETHISTYTVSVSIPTSLGNSELNHPHNRPWLILFDATTRSFMMTCASPKLRPDGKTQSLNG
jgi:hypothetical protein